MTGAGGHDHAEKRGWPLTLGLSGIWFVLLAFITLTPVELSRPDPEYTPFLCVFCGSRGLADGILNVVLFLPLGVLLGRARGLAFSLVAGLLLSASIEAIQLHIPGRFPSASDLIWNTMGAVLGAVLVVSFRRWLPRSPGSAGALALGLPLVYLAGAGLLASPLGTDERYFGGWTIRLGHLEPYEGRLLEAELNGEPLPWGVFPRHRPPPKLDGDLQVTAVVEKGLPPRAVAPIATIYDAVQNEIFLLGASGEDLVWRLRDRAIAMGFDYREIRFRDALAPAAVGDTIRLEVRRSESELCLAVDGRRSCGLGFSPGRTWSYLMNLEGASPAFRRGLDVAWMATLFFLVGVLGGGPRRVLLLGGIAVTAVVVTVLATPLIPAGTLEWLGLGLGIAAGVLSRPLLGAIVGARPTVARPKGRG